MTKSDTNKIHKMKHKFGSVGERLAPDTPFSSKLKDILSRMTWDEYCERCDLKLLKSGEILLSEN